MIRPAQQVGPTTSIRGWWEDECSPTPGLKPGQEAGPRMPDYLTDTPRSAPASVRSVGSRQSEIEYYVANC